MGNSLDHDEGSGTVIHANNQRGEAYLGLKVVLPLVQGMLWTLALSGWRYWHRTAEYQGSSLGSRVRRWWWGVNNWTIPEAKYDETMAEDVGEVGNCLLGSLTDSGKADLRYSSTKVSSALARGTE